MRAALHLGALLALLGAPASGGARYRYEAEVLAAVEEVRGVYAVPAALVRAVVKVESNFDPKAHSKAGAIGLMQVMPFNAGRLGFSVEELWEPRKNLVAGTRLLAVLLVYYQGDVVGALAAYNARPRRPGAQLPQNGETPAYVWRVLREWRRYEAEKKKGQVEGAGARGGVGEGGKEKT